MAKKTPDIYPQLLADIKSKTFHPIYLLMGGESYYIDMLTDAIVEHALDDTERDFNQTIIYGASDIGIATIVNAAKRYPIMAERQLVVVKEAQQIEKWELIIPYLQHPLQSTILVLCFKTEKSPGKKLVTLIEKEGVVYESKKLYDTQLPIFIRNNVAAKGYTIEPKAVGMLADAIGRDLSRLISELDKLTISMEDGVEKRITASLVERNIGISKEYNNFELRDAIINRDYYKACSIAAYFEKNPKSNPLVVTVSVLFNFFSNLLLLFMANARSEHAIKGELDLRTSFQAKDYLTALNNYNAYKCIDIISLLRKCDVRSKGVGNNTTTTSHSELLKELLFSIMH